MMSDDDDDDDDITMLTCARKPVDKRDRGKDRTERRMHMDKRCIT